MIELGAERCLRAEIMDSSISGWWALRQRTGKATLYFFSHEKVLHLFNLMFSMPIQLSGTEAFQPWHGPFAMFSDLACVVLIR